MAIIKARFGVTASLTERRPLDFKTRARCTALGRRKGAAYLDLCRGQDFDLALARLRLRRASRSTGL